MDVNYAVNLQTNRGGVKAFAITIAILISTVANGQEKTPATQPFIFIPKQYDLSSISKTATVAPNYISKNQGFVCRQEWLVEKKTGLPLRVRLGSLDYVNKLEGK